MTTRTGSRSACAGRTALLLAVPCALPALAAEGSASLADALLRDSETTLHFRSHYLDRDRPAGIDNVAWAAGGWLGYRSGWAGNALRLGLTAYTSQKLYGPEDKDGTALLLAGQRSYTVLGEGFGALRHAGHVLTAGRFLVNQFEVNPQDTRMTPRTFQGVSLLISFNSLPLLFTSTFHPEYLSSRFSLPPFGVWGANGIS